MIPSSSPEHSNFTSSNNSLNRARIEEESEFSISLSISASSRKKTKSLPHDETQTFDFRSSFSSMINQLSQTHSDTKKSIFCTPTMSKSKIQDQKSYGKTLTIRGKKGFLYRQICPICLGQFNDSKGSLPCSHSFCCQCIQQWAKTSSQCPCCRQNFSQIENIQKNGEVKIIQVSERQAVFEEADYYICYNCGSGEDEHVLLICDHCDFYCCHIYCDPILRNNIPQGDWYCKYCQQRMNRINNSNQNLNMSISSIDSVSEESVQTGENVQTSNIKPVATRTRSRTIEPNARIFQRLRRRR